MSILLNRRVQSAGLAFALVLSSFIDQAHALPYAGADISALVKRVSLEGIGQVMGDSQNNHTLYVMPGEKKFKGKFAQLAGGVDCQDLFKLRANTFNMPAKEKFRDAVEASRFFSPAFESLIGVRARNTDVLLKISEVKARVANYISEHQEIYGEYSRSKTNFELTEKDFELSQTIIDERTSKLTQEMMMSTSDQEKLKLREEYRRDMFGLIQNRNMAQSKKARAQSQYMDAIRDWAPYRDQLDWMTNVENNLSISYQKMQEIADDSLKASQELMRTLESKVIGLASVSYSLSPDREVETLNLRIKNAYEDAGVANYHAQALPVFNVTLNPGVTQTVRSVHDADMGLDYELTTYHLPAHTRLTLGTQKTFVELPGNIAKEGLSDGQTDKTKIRFLVADMNGGFGGSQAMNMPVTQGSVCGRPKTELISYEYVDSNGRRVAREVNRTTYEAPTHHQPVFVQDVALRYNYYAKSEPISGFCELDIHKTANYTRNAGHSRSWSWFKVTTHTWDDTRKNFSNDMGLKCQLTKRPQGSNPEESKQLNDTLEKALYQDMFHMFVMSYGKEYKVEPIAPELRSVDSTFFSKIGTGVMGLCGSNPYCAIGGIVLKSLDELVGARHSGVTSDSTTMNGKLTKRFDVDTYHVAEGASNIQLRVCVDHKKCDE